MELKFKKFQISNNKLSYVLKIKNDNKNYYYTDIEDLLNAIPNRIILKSEATDIEKLIKELKSLKTDIKKIIKNEK